MIESAETIGNAEAEAFPHLSPRELRRHATQHRINLAAQELADRHGLDGFTMDDLATATGLSRRTLFNYFPTKDDAVLGGLPNADLRQLGLDEALKTQPDLIGAIDTVVDRVLRVKDVDPEHIRRGQRLMDTHPRLAALAKRRFAEWTTRASEEWPGSMRGDDPLTPHSVRLVVFMVAAIFDVSLDQYLKAADPGGGDRLAALFSENLALARGLLGPQRA